MTQINSTRKGGRPAKNLAEKRKYRLSLKLNTNEYFQLKSKAKIACKNRCDFIRELILLGEVKQRFSPEQNDIFRKIGGMANNLNQLTHLAHVQGLFFIEISCKKLISDKNEKFRSTKICRELTEKHGLYIAPGKENVNRERLIGYDKTKYEIYDALQRAIPKCRTWNELENRLKKDKISFQFKTNGNTDKIQGIIFEKDGTKINGSKVDRNCSFSKIDRQIKDNAYHALQEAAHQAQLANSASSAVDTLSSLIAQFNVFTLFDSPHYDATLADYIKSLKARKLAAQNRVRIHRIG